LQGNRNTSKECRVRWISLLKTRSARHSIAALDCGARLRAAADRLGVCIAGSCTDVLPGAAIVVSATARHVHETPLPAQWAGDVVDKFPGTGTPPG